jgi:hypothetical protein
VSSGGGSQFVAWAVNKLICDTNRFGSSRLEAVIIITPGITSARPAIRELHVGQKRRVIGWPLPPIVVYSVSLPVIDTASSGKAITALWPEPLTLRQSSQ